MLGGFRLLLASVVVLYHVGYRPFGLHIGVSAVVAFYMVSGYAMSAMWRRWYATDGDLRGFYLDRLLRLYPQYIVFCALSAAIIFGFGWKLDLFQVGSIGWANLIAHVTMVPLSLATVRPDIGQFMLIPQSWSLGTELLFYFVFPALQSRSATAIAMITSLSVFTIAASGAVNPDAFAYRLLPGCLFIFLIGALIQRGDREMLRLTIALFVSIVIGLVATKKLSVGFNKELILGATGAIVAVSVLTRRTSDKLDTWFGDLSYGVYLAHMILIVIVAHLGWFADDLFARCSMVIVGSLIVAVLAFLCIEKPAADYRKRLRKQRLTSSAFAPA
jgi:peptidoglycan/LPS O-acetylase OafA/YrhL